MIPDILKFVIKNKKINLEAKNPAISSRTKNLNIIEPQIEKHYAKETYVQLSMNLDSVYTGIHWF